MPDLMIEGQKALVAIAKDVMWQDPKTILKDCFVRGDHCYCLCDPTAYGALYAEDKRFERGLFRVASASGLSRYHFACDGSPLPKPIHTFDPFDPEHRTFMKCLKLGTSACTAGYKDVLTN